MRAFLWVVNSAFLSEECGKWRSYVNRVCVKGKGDEATMTVPEKGTSGRPRQRLDYGSAAANPA